MVKPVSQTFFRISTLGFAGWAWLLFALAASFAMGPDFSGMRLLAEQRYGPGGREAVVAWEGFLAETAGLPIEDKIARVNIFFNNKIIYVEDLLTWGQADYWATPLETLGRGQGDCEDFAFAKYVSLRMLGVPAECLRLTYVRAKLVESSRVTTRAHMVLGYYPAPESEPLILDSLVPDIRPASKRRDLYPIFSFNTNQLWVTGKNPPVADSSARLSNWRKVLGRMHDEGLRLIMQD